MKTILRYIVFYSFALYIVSQLVSGLVILGGIKTMFMAGAVFALLNVTVKPFLKAIAFPFMFFTLGLFSFVVDAGTLFLLTKIIHDVQVHAFSIQKLSYQTYTIPHLQLNVFFAYIVLSAIIAFLTMFFMLLSE